MGWPVLTNCKSMYNAAPSMAESRSRKLAPLPRRFKEEADAGRWLAELSRRALPPDVRDDCARAECESGPTALASREREREWARCSLRELPSLRLEAGALDGETRLDGAEYFAKVNEIEMIEMQRHKRARHA